MNRRRCDVSLRDADLMVTFIDYSLPIGEDLGTEIFRTPARAYGAIGRWLRMGQITTEAGAVRYDAAIAGGR